MNASTASRSQIVVELERLRNSVTKLVERDERLTLLCNDAALLLEYAKVGAPFTDKDRDNMVAKLRAAVKDNG